jgi:hypothetical protein
MLALPLLQTVAFDGLDEIVTLGVTVGVTVTVMPHDVAVVG